MHIYIFIVEFYVIILYNYIITLHGGVIGFDSILEVLIASSGWQPGHYKRFQLNINADNNQELAFVA